MGGRALGWWLGHPGSGEHPACPVRPGRGKGRHQNKSQYCQYCFHKRSTTVNKAPSFLNITWKQKGFTVLITNGRFFHLLLLWANLRCPRTIFSLRSLKGNSIQFSLGIIPLNSFLEIWRGLVLFFFFF